MIQENILNTKSFERLNVWLGDLLKRGFDIVVSSIVLVLLAPFIASIAVAIKRDSPGPVFFRGKRIGRGGKYFNILKFRTMYEKPESYAGPKVTALNDPRVSVHHVDARYFVKTQRNRYDLVIARLPEPTSALRARLYTDEFYGELRRAMRSQVWATSR